MGHKLQMEVEELKVKLGEALQNSVVKDRQVEASDHKISNLEDVVKDLKDVKGRLVKEIEAKETKLGEVESRVIKEKQQEKKVS